MTPCRHPIRKSTRAFTGGRLLLHSDDTEGACNLAYCAMFDAAHAALVAVGAESPDAPIKTHNVLIIAFGQCAATSCHPNMRPALAKFNDSGTWQIIP
jgi:uncharacterized protein (UPF0332 family)